MIRHQCDDNCPGFGPVPAQPVLPQRTPFVMHQYVAMWPDQSTTLTVERNPTVTFRSHYRGETNFEGRYHRSEGARWLRLMRHFQATGHKVELRRIV